MNMGGEKDMLLVVPRETHKMVSVKDIRYVRSMVEHFKASEDAEEAAIGLIAEAVLERLKLNK